MTLSRRDWLALAALVGLAIGLPAVLGWLGGALDIPHNDDFDYRRIALALWADGRLEFRGFAVMSLVGQVVAVQPLLWLSGGAPWSFAATTATFTVVGIGSAYLLVRRVLDAPWATLAVLAVVVVPGFLVNTTDFMTDVPAFATAFLCLALGAAAIRPDGQVDGSRVDGRRLVASLAAGCLAVSIRDSTLAAPMAVLFVAGVVDTRRVGRYLAIAVALVLFVALIHVLLSYLPGQAEARYDPSNGILRVRQGFSTLAVCLVPALIVAIARWRARWRLVDLVPGLAVGMVVAWQPLVVLARTGHLPFMLVGNLFTQIGPVGAAALAGNRPVIYPNVVWTVVQFAAFGATILMPAVVTGIIGTVLRAGGVSRARIREWAAAPTALLVAFVGFTAAGLVVYGYLFTMFDRYLWPLVVAASALLLIPSPPAAETEANDRALEAEARPPAGWAGRVRPAPVLAIVALAALGTLSILNLLASNAFAAARWEFGEAAVAAGIPAGSVDAGMEWVGYYATGTATPLARGRAGQMWYTSWWPSYRQCGVVSSVELERPGYVLIRSDPAAYRQFQLFGQELPLYAYRVDTPACA